jgi:hypothetical protein
MGDKKEKKPLAFPYHSFARHSLELADCDS